MTTISLTVTAKEKRELTALAKRLRLSPAQVLRRCFREAGWQLPFAL